MLTFSLFISVIINKANYTFDSVFVCVVIVVVVVVVVVVAGGGGGVSKMSSSLCCSLAHDCLLVDLSGFWGGEGGVVRVGWELSCLAF